MVLDMNRQQVLLPAYVVLLALTQPLRHTGMTGELFKVLPTLFKDAPGDWTPSLDFHHDALISHYGNMPHENTSSHRAFSKLQSGEQEDGSLTQLTRCIISMWCICHHAPKTKAERFIMLFKQKLNEITGKSSTAGIPFFPKSLLFCCTNTY